VFVCAYDTTKLQLGKVMTCRALHMVQVESAALNEASHTDKGPCGKKDGPVFHTRGLTLSEEHRCADHALQRLFLF
jgi:Protein DA1